MSKVNEQTYLTVREVSDYLGVSQTAVYELTHSQDFPVFRIGSRRARRREKENRRGQTSAPMKRMVCGGGRLLRRESRARDRPP